MDWQYDGFSAAQSAAPLNFSIGWQQLAQRVMRTMKSHRLASAVSITLAFGSLCCGSAPPPPVSPEPGMVAASEEAEQVADAERLIVKKAQVTLEVEAVPEGRDRVVAFVEEMNGYLENIVIEEGKPAVLVVRIPAGQLDNFLDRLDSLGRVGERRVESTDITEQAIDLQARVDNLIAVRDRLRNHLDKAREVGEILAIERELTRVQSELDSMDGRLKYLRSAASASVVTVTIKRPQVLGPLGYVGKGIWWGISKLFVIHP